MSFRKLIIAAVAVCLLVVARHLVTTPTRRSTTATHSLPATARDAAVRRRVRVVDGAGQPVHGATVIALRPVRRYEQVEEQLAPWGTLTAAEEGSFDLAGPSQREGIMLVAQKHGLAIGWAFLPNDPSGGPRTRRGGSGASVQPAAEVEIRLTEATSLSGTVVDHAGEAIEGASVELMLRPPEDDGKWLIGHGAIASLMTETDPAGSFTFSNVPEGCAGEFKVEAAGRARLDTRLRRPRRPTSPESQAKLVLQPEATIEVVAVEKGTGKPVGDAVLMAMGRPRGKARLGVCVLPAEGRYRFDRLSAGRYSVRPAQPTGTAAPCEWAGRPTRVELKAGRCVTARIELTRGGLVEARVADDETGRDIAGATVEVTTRRFRSVVRAGNDGVARVRLPEGDYEVSPAHAEGYRRSSQRHTASVVEGKTLRLDFKLRRLPAVRGLVRDETGRSVKAVRVAILPAERYSRTDSAGRFAIRMDFHRWPYLPRLPLVARDAVSNRASAVEIREGQTPIDLKLLPALAVRGKVGDADGKPIAGAGVGVLLGRSCPLELPAIGRALTDAEGRYEVKALPPGQHYFLRVRARGYATSDAHVTGGAGGVRTLDFTLPRVTTTGPAAVAKALPVPKIPGGRAVWGATGRDSRGHIWFGASMSGGEHSSAHLMEYDPSRDKVIDRGNVVEELSKAGIARADEGQMKIHSKIFQGPDGCLYFTSMDEHGEVWTTGKLATWGGHLWRLHLPAGGARGGASGSEAPCRWEHLMTTPEPLIALSLGGGKVYALGYWQHVLYRYDISTGRHRSVKVGSDGGHVSRNILTDARGHVYVPRVKAAPGEVPTATLVEYDAELKEVHRTPLTHYFHGRLANAHGITGWARLPDGSVAFMTHNGFLSRLRPVPGDGPAEVTDLGWFYPSGPKYAASLFADAAGRRLMGMVNGGRGIGARWVTMDLKTHRRHLATVTAEMPKDVPVASAIYGSETRDDAGNCYVAGGYPAQPVVVRVQPPGD